MLSEVAGRALEMGEDDFLNLEGWHRGGRDSIPAPHSSLDSWIKTQILLNPSCPSAGVGESQFPRWHWSRKLAMINERGRMLLMSYALNEQGNVKDPIEERWGTGGREKNQLRGRIQCPSLDLGIDFLFQLHGWTIKHRRVRISSSYASPSSA